VRVGDRDHDRQRRHAAFPRTGAAQHRGRDRERVVGDLPVAHRESGAADLGQRAAQLRRVPDGERGEGGERRGQHRLLHVGGRVREQDQPDAGRVQRPVRPDLGQDRHGVPPGDPLDVYAVPALAHRELDVLVGRLVEVLHERQRDVPEPVTAGAQRGQFDQAQPDPVPAVLAALQATPPRQLTDQPVRGGQGKAGMAGQLGEAVGGVLVAVRVQQSQQLGGHTARAVSHTEH
jgi:hypothetical protein